AACGPSDADSRSATRPASQRPASAARRAPRSGSRPVQFGIAVRRKPATAAKEKPKTISWTCQMKGARAPGSAACPENDSSQAGTAAADHSAAPRKKGRNAAENTPRIVAPCGGEG